MNHGKDILFSFEGKQTLERQIISCDCCLDDFAKEVCMQNGIKNKKAYGVYSIESGTVLNGKVSINDISEDKPLYVGMVKTINVSIHYGTGTQIVSSSPSKPIQSFLEAAIDHFNPEDAKDKSYELEIAETEQQPDKSLSIGTLIAGNGTDVEMNLVPSERWQG